MNTDTKKELSDFEVMGIMASENMDIRMSDNFLGGQKIKGGAEIKMGVDFATFQQLALQTVTDERKYYVVLYVINKEQFSEIKNTTTCH